MASTVTGNPGGTFTLLLPAPPVLGQAATHLDIGCPGGRSPAFPPPRYNTKAQGQPRARPPRGVMDSAAAWRPLGPGTPPPKLDLDIPSNQCQPPDPAWPSLSMLLRGWGDGNLLGFLGHKRATHREIKGRRRDPGAGAGLPCLSAALLCPLLSSPPAFFLQTGRVCSAPASHPGRRPRSAHGPGPRLVWWKRTP